MLLWVHMSSLKHSVICEWLNELRLLLRVGRQRLPAVHYYGYFLTCLLAFPNPNQQRSVIIILQYNNVHTRHNSCLHWRKFWYTKSCLPGDRIIMATLEIFLPQWLFKIKKKNKSRFWLLFYSAPLLFNKVPSISSQSSAQNCISYFVAVSTV